MIKYTDVDGLIPEGGMVDSLKVFLWAVSGFNSGKIANAKFEIKAEDPYLSIDDTKIHEL